MFWWSFTHFLITVFARDTACDNPTTPEIFDSVVQGLKLEADIEVSGTQLILSPLQGCLSESVLSSGLLCVGALLSAYLILLQKKRHPKDWKYLGRVRVQLKDDSGKPVNPDIPSSECSDRGCTHLSSDSSIFL